LGRDNLPGGADAQWVAPLEAAAGGMTTYI
jgi:hypothetical protein